MDDYRGKYCLIDSLKIMKCVGQDFTLNRIYFRAEYYNDNNSDHAQSFWLPEDRIRVLTDKELANLNLYSNIKGDV